MSFGEQMLPFRSENRKLESLDTDSESSVIIRISRTTIKRLPLIKSIIPVP